MFKQAGVNSQEIRLLSEGTLSFTRITHRVTHRGNIAGNDKTTWHRREGAHCLNKQGGGSHLDTGETHQGGSTITQEGRKLDRTIPFSNKPGNTG